MTTDDEHERVVAQYHGALRNLVDEVRASPAYRRGGLKVSVAIRVAESVMSKYPVDTGEVDDG